MHKTKVIKFDQSITIANVAGLLDLPEREVRLIISKKDFPQLKYRYLTDIEIQTVQIDISRILRGNEVQKSGENELERWEKGWLEILDRIRLEGVSMDALTPQYFHYNIFRYRGRYIQSASRRFEQDIFELLKNIVIMKYLSTVSHIVELGCGTGKNLLMMRTDFKQKKLTGCDWAVSSQELIGQINRVTGAEIKAVNLNLFSMEGWQDVAIDSNTGVLTIHALEQLGSDIDPILKSIYEARPHICVHIEPILELYDPKNLFDQVAIDYHYKRNYLSGFYSKLLEWDEEGKINILKVCRTSFGSMFQEAYTVVVWEIV
jgi:hypothetical protein